MDKPSAIERLSTYWSKRDFKVTGEPRGETARAGKSLSFVIQKHAASHLHYDFRLELNGVLVSWAVPKGPSLDPSDKRMAIHVEDHPLSYASFEGTIPPKQYGAGTVIVWDNGSWEPVGDAVAGIAKGKLEFRLNGQKLHGVWELIKLAKGGERQEAWLLFKKRDEFARPRTEFDVVVSQPDSVIAKPLSKTNALPVREVLPAARKTGSAAKTKPDTTGSPIEGGVKGKLPDDLSPQLATLATAVPAAGEWLYEIKFDGYRIMARFARGVPTLMTRGGHDWSERMPQLIAELKALGVQSGWLDGEIVVLGVNGAPDFNALQKSFDRKTSASGISYFVFDVPFLNGYDLRGAALKDRRELLRGLIEGKDTGHVRFSADFLGSAGDVLGSACRMGLEGVIAKRTDSPYQSRRSDSWLKLKCKLRQEFVVCGYTDRSDGAAQVGSLLLGVYADNGDLVSVGSVGTGWSSKDAAELLRTLGKLRTSNAPFTAGAVKTGRWSRRLAGSERWLKPLAVAEVEFAEWTPDGNIRHASFVSLRTDKPATEIRRETATDPAGTPPVVTQPPATKITHGERVIDASSGATKLQLVRYYESVADWILPHLKGRPCSLVRGPDGVSGQLFFQKHGEKIGIPGITELDARLWPGHGALLEVASVKALAGCAQMNVIEFHTWNSTVKNIDKPDRMIFDLDPGEGTSWKDIQEAASLVRGFLTELGLAAWLKTSGGKGLHVVVPLAARLDYGTVKDFSQAIVQHLAKVIPSRFVSKSGPSNRIGKLFVDYLRNGHGATTVAAFSARARPGLGVSMPVAWDDLQGLKSGSQWTIFTAREHLSFQTVDPWADFWAQRQTLTKAMKTIGFKPDQKSR